MNKKISQPKGVIVAGVGGQGTITLAQLILGAAWKSGYKAIQSEVHGMSQRGGSVNAQIIFDNEVVSSPLVMEGTGDLLISVEPLEALRYLYLLKDNAPVVSSISPVINMANYPNLSDIIDELKKIKTIHLIDTEKYSLDLNNKNAGNIILLGVASKYLPFTNAIWIEVIKERFMGKSEDVVDKNLEAFDFGQKLT